MILRPITVDSKTYPAAIQPYLLGAQLYDSSCSNQATVIYIAKEAGWFLKRSAPGSLEREAALTAFFHEKGLAGKVIEYVRSNDFDYLLTEKVRGEDCTAVRYLAQPARLCDTMASRLAWLHSLDFSGCPVPDHTAQYLQRAHANYRAGYYDIKLFPDNWGYQTVEEAYAVVRDKGQLLQTDTLLHGDYCLPNIILADWEFSGLVDLDSGGVGDRHIDLFWGAWTLSYNLKTDQYRERFFDAYGRAKVDQEKLRLVAACEVFG